MKRFDVWLTGLLLRFPWSASQRATWGSSSLMSSGNAESLSRPKCQVDNGAPFADTSSVSASFELDRSALSENFWPEFSVRVLTSIREARSEQFCWCSSWWSRTRTTCQSLVGTDQPFQLVKKKDKKVEKLLKIVFKKITSSLHTSKKFRFDLRIKIYYDLLRFTSYHR